MVQGIAGCILRAAMDGPYRDAGRAPRRSVCVGALANPPRFPATPIGAAGGRPYLCRSLGGPRQHGEQCGVRAGGEGLEMEEQVAAGRRKSSRAKRMTASVQVQSLVPSSVCFIHGKDSSHVFLRSAM